MSLLKDILKSTPTQKATPVVVEKQSMIKEFSSVQTALKNSDATDAGKSDVVDRATSANDIGFNLMRNTINSSGSVSGSDVADYIERAEELNDEVDTVPFGLETDDGKIVKVYVNAEQADQFEEAMKNMLGLEDDIEEAINRLAGEFDIVDVVWPKSDDDVDDDGNVDDDADLDIDDTSNLDGEEDDDFGPDDYDVIAGGDTTDSSVAVAEPGSGKVQDKDEEPESEEDAENDTDDSDDDATDDDSEDSDESDEEDSDDDSEDDDEDSDKPKKKKKKKKADSAAPAEPATAAESKIFKGSLLQEVNKTVSKHK